MPFPGAPERSWRQAQGALRRRKEQTWGTTESGTRKREGALMGGGGSKCRKMRRRGEREQTNATP
eukprot:2291440-Rhodomonas_salina.2